MIISGLVLGLAVSMVVVGGMLLAAMVTGKDKKF